MVDHLGAPVGPDNPVGAIDQELEKLGDLDDLWRQVEHARRVAKVAKQSWEDFVAAHYPELIENRRDEAAAIAEEANDAAQVFAAVLRKYLEFHSRIAGFTHPIRGITTHAVPGLEAATDLLRIAGTVDLRPPIPEEE